MKNSGKQAMEKALLSLGALHVVTTQDLESYVRMSAGTRPPPATLTRWVRALTQTGALVWRKDYSASVDTSKLFTGTAASPPGAGHGMTGRSHCTGTVGQLSVTNEFRMTMLCGDSLSA